MPSKSIQTNGEVEDQKSLLKNNKNGVHSSNFCDAKVAAFFNRGDCNVVIRYCGIRCWG